ncbi:MAG: GIY-YIG nuclease family protein [Candidatus Cloacimonadota bacterium]|nr:GIY-YIG nuclease family protein [Candidatus Cloacimonadota bacterium]
MFYYVYILTSITHADRHYTGYTKDLDKRLAKHNNGEVKHTLKYKLTKKKMSKIGNIHFL